jgi:hypothetical protein
MKEMPILDRTRFRAGTIILICTILALVGSAAATPYWTPEQVAEEFTRSGAATAPRFQMPAQARPGRNSLDEVAYFSHYLMLCQFLASMQYTATGNNHGGMIEGESGNDHSIIQTDNTQEAIREWSQYAIWTGDTATYGENIRQAWLYCGRYPAWREEGGGYYAAHNCGWGFEAERKYRQAYGDTSKLWYADSCARWVVANPLTINLTGTDLTQLDPLAEGLAIGGLYPHAVFRGDTVWRNFALLKGRQLERWVERNPQRLNANEQWALCGGTALWGICESVFAAYPDSGATWLATYGPDLDTWQSVGSWNHSACAWYCNAQNKVFEITRDSTYWNNAVFITDSLIGLDTDHDGGIYPGVGYNSTNDHSWVSSYMGWMGMERIINSRPMHDVAAIGFDSPNPNLPYVAGDSLIVSVQAGNYGLLPATAWIRVIGETYADSMQVELPAGCDSVFRFVRRWVVPDNEGLPATSPLRLEVTTANDGDLSNDTLTSAFDIRHGYHIEVAIENGDHVGVPAQVKIYHEAYPGLTWLTGTSDSTGRVTFGTRPLMAGSNRIHVSPPAKYLSLDTNVTLPGNFESLILRLSTTQLALIDDSPGDTVETYYRTSLDTFHLATRLWENSLDGTPDLTHIPTVIWFTGGAITNTLDTNEQAAITNYLRDGGHLILSGQNITDDLGSTSPFLTTVLQCSSRTVNTGLRSVVGVAGNSITEGMNLALSGSGGARNQTSPASIWVLPGATEIFRYPQPNSESCGAVGEYGFGRFVFLSFGLEAASGLNHSTTRTQALWHLFSYLGDSISSAEERPELPLSLELRQNFPNPFNPSTSISFVAPTGLQPVTLTVYNVLGQEVKTLYDGRGTGQAVTLTWDGMTSSGLAVSSGLYVYRLRAGTTMLTKTLQLVR